MTTKVMDNTIISTSLKEIKCVNLIKKCSERYTIATSYEVYLESCKGFSETLLKELYKTVVVRNLTDDKRYILLIDYLQTRYPYLHSGELSSFLLALLDYELNRKEYYYVTDDNKMKKVISKMGEDDLFSEKIGSPIKTFNVTGTIGLIRKLYENGSLSTEDIERIIEDLKNSTFYITPDLISYLKVAK